MLRPRAHVGAGARVESRPSACLAVVALCSRVRETAEEVAEHFATPVHERPTERLHLGETRRPSCRSGWLARLSLAGGPSFGTAGRALRVRCCRRQSGWLGIALVAQRRRRVCAQSPNAAGRVRPPLRRPVALHSGTHGEPHRRRSETGAHPGSEGGAGGGRIRRGGMWTRGTSGPLSVRLPTDRRCGTRRYLEHRWRPRLAAGRWQGRNLGRRQGWRLTARRCGRARACWGSWGRAEAVTNASTCPGRGALGPLAELVVEDDR
jgi:hypothetical protein